MIDSPISAERETSPRDAARSIRATRVGSWREITLPADFAALFHDDYLADPRNRTPMEMDGYSAYLALKAIEARDGGDFTAGKRALIAAVLARLDRGIPFGHAAWTGSEHEVHLRFTAAAVRLLAEGARDGLLDDHGAIDRAWRYHLSFVSTIGGETWFLHDSLEVAGTGLAYPQRRIGRPAWGASAQNNVVLNTHLDTLSTAIDVLPLLDPATAAATREAIASGLKALDLVLAARRSAVAGGIDRAARAAMLQLFRLRGSRFERLRAAAVHRTFVLRARLRAREPAFVCADGFIDRDVRLAGDTLHYHLVNVCDLLKLLHKLRNSPFVAEHGVAARIEAAATAGLDHAIDSGFRHYLRVAAGQNSLPVLLCEAILLRLALTGAELPPRWRDAYCDVRRVIAPSPALLGYDPFVVGAPDALGPIIAGIDRVVLLDGRRIEVDAVSRSARWLN